MMQKLIQRVEQLEIRPQRSHDSLRSVTPTTTSRSKPRQLSQVTCYRCGQVGHFAYIHLKDHTVEGCTLIDHHGHHHTEM